MSNRVTITAAESASAPSYNSVLAKLGLFTVFMAIAPVSAYFLSLHYFFEGTNQNGAAITAAVTANIILFGYVIVALIEDQTSPSAPAPVQKEEKKTL